MQNLTKIIYDLRRNNKINENQTLNFVREYLQVKILKSIYQSKYGRSLSFHGGTCLRICNGLKRYSEDLDFTLDREKTNFSFIELNKNIEKFLITSGFDVQLEIKSHKIVNKSFIQFINLLHNFEIDYHKNAKLMIKLEVDTNPVKIYNSEVESYFITKYDEIFPIIKHTNSTLFAGKICAVFSRAYTKGRDFYDLFWYLNNMIDVNYKYLNRLFKQASINVKCKQKYELVRLLKEKIDKIDFNNIMKDIGRFLEDPEEEIWLRNYPLLFNQITKKWLQTH